MSDTVYCEVVERPIESVPVPQYTDIEHGTWGLLLAKQESLIHGRACKEFIAGLDAIHFPKNRIPALKDVSAIIQKNTGWKLIRVDGLVEATAFFELLAKKIFPSTDFIRKREELDYTPAPDMFHDLFGHAPLLTNPDFTEFFETFGHVGVAAAKKYPKEHEIHKMLPRLYWFTVEFGLIQTSQGLRAYGSGSCSSPQELEFCVSPKCRHHQFDVDVVAARDYDIWHLQEDVFVIDSFQQLGQEFRRWSKAQGLL
jgi:phenylalanine-4-hydroxylase